MKKEMEEYLKDEIEKGFLELDLPIHMKGGITNYLVHGISPGGFLYALLSNDLKGAAGRADNQNCGMLKEWVMFICNYMPSASQGSPEHVKEWLAKFEVFLQGVTYEKNT